MKWLCHQRDALLLAIAFLTRIPVGGCMMALPAEFPTSLAYFTSVGALVGAIGWAVFAAVSSLGISPILAVLASMLATIWITGSFHEDGLADTADGLWGGHDKAKRLEIMKDSRIGTHGTIAVWFALTVKAVLLLQLAEEEMIGLALVCAHAVGRATSLSLIMFLDYVGEGPGSKAAPFVKKRPLVPCLCGILIAVALTLGVLREDGAWALLALPAAALFGAWYFRRKIGGITGDCLGAVNQVAEVGFYAILAHRLFL